MTFVLLSAAILAIASSVDPYQVISKEAIGGGSTLLVMQLVD